MLQKLDSRELPAPAPISCGRGRAERRKFWAHPSPLSSSGYFPPKRCPVQAVPRGRRDGGCRARACGVGSGWTEDVALGLWHPACWVEDATCILGSPWAPTSQVPVSAGSSKGPARTWPASLCICAFSAGLSTFTCEQWCLPWCLPSSNDWEADPGAHRPLPFTPSWIGGAMWGGSQCNAHHLTLLHKEEWPEQG